MMVALQVVDHISSVAISSLDHTGTVDANRWSVLGLGSSFLGGPSFLEGVVVPDWVGLLSRRLGCHGNCSLLLVLIR